MNLKDLATHLYNKHNMSLISNEVLSLELVFTTCFNFESLVNDEPSIIAGKICDYVIEMEERSPLLIEMISKSFMTTLFKASQSLRDEASYLIKERRNDILEHIDLTLVSLLLKIIMDTDQTNDLYGNINIGMDDNGALREIVFTMESGYGI